MDSGSEKEATKRKTLGASFTRSRRVKWLYVGGKILMTWMLVLTVTCLLGIVINYGDGTMSKAISLSSRISQFSRENGQQNVYEILAMTGYMMHWEPRGNYLIRLYRSWKIFPGEIKSRPIT